MGGGGTADILGGPGAGATGSTYHASDGRTLYTKACCKCVASGSSTPSTDNPRGKCGVHPPGPPNPPELPPELHPGLPPAPPELPPLR